MLILSGAQTGADISAIKTAKSLGIPTGGWIPKGCITLDGCKPEYLELYNLKEHTSPKYPPRTYANVRDSDATIRFASYFYSPGELCTLKAINYYKKPYLDIDVRNPKPIKEVLEWIKQFEIINVAGNSEKTSPGIEKFVENYMKELLNEYLSQFPQRHPQDTKP